jgi:hypothetical protein
MTLASLAIFFGLRAENAKPAAGPALVYTSTPHYDSLAWLHGAERFPSGAKLMLLSGTSSRELIAGFFASADANVSFDGTRVLFAGKKSYADTWQIWEVDISGGEPKQLTRCANDCVRPLYLPDDRIVYAHKIDGRYQVEATSAGRGETVGLTTIPGNALPTGVLRDGRILFEAGFPLGSNSSSELYTVYPDGSGVESYRCDHGKGRHSGAQVGSGDIVFVEEGNFGRFTSAVAHEVQVKAPYGEYAGDVIEAGAERLIVPWRERLTDFYSLQEWDVTADALKTLTAQEQKDLVQPQMIAPRPKPKRFPSALHDWNGANVLCLNTYTSKLKIAKSSVETVALYTLKDGKPSLLGRAHVESDGSFFLHVPSDQPLQIELLDKAGNTLQRERGWFWMRRGEQRFCVGCHAGPERAPENAMPQVLLKSTEPTDTTGKSTSSVKGGH